MSRCGNKKCNKVHDGTYGSGRFCSKSCACSRTWTKADKEKKSKAAKASSKLLEANSNPEKYRKAWKTRRANGNGRQKRKQKVCTYCKNSFESVRTPNGNGWRTWCSSECYAAIKRRNYRGTTYRYKGVCMDSSWEVELAEWMDRHKIKWVRPEFLIWQSSNGTFHKYFPDFYLPCLDLYVDPKNELLVESQKEKLEYISNKVSLLYGNVEFLKKEITLLNQS